MQMLFFNLTDKKRKMSNKLYMILTFSSMFYTNVIDKVEGNRKFSISNLTQKRREDVEKQILFQRKYFMHKQVKAPRSVV